MLRSALLAVLGALVLAACGGNAPTAQVDGLRLKKSRTGYPTLTGYVVNTSAEATIRSADVFVTLYDGDNRPLDAEAFVQVRDVAPGDSARFEQRLDVPALAASFRTMILN